MSVPSVRPVFSTAVAKARGETALVAEAGRQAVLLQDRLERVVDLGALAQRLGERGRADRRDHELLDVDVGVGVGATVQDVHHRDGQYVGVGAADVAEQREAGGVGGGLGEREGDAEDGVGAELRLVGRAVEGDHGGVDGALVVGVEADDLGGDGRVDGLDGLADALAEVAVATVTQLDGLELAGGGTGGDGGASDGPVVEGDLDLDGGVAARVEDLACSDGFDAGHAAPAAVVVRSVPSLVPGAVRP